MLRAARLPVAAQVEPVDPDKTFGEAARVQIVSWTSFICRCPGRSAPLGSFLVYRMPLDRRGRRAADTSRWGLREGRLHDAARRPIPPVVHPTTVLHEQVQALYERRQRDCIFSVAAVGTPDLCGNQNHPTESFAPPRHRRDACSMAWRCRFLTARRSQHGRVVAEK